jgi:hypothetical protein
MSGLLQRLASQTINRSGNATVRPMTRLPFARHEELTTSTDENFVTTSPSNAKQQNTQRESATLNSQRDGETLSSNDPAGLPSAFFAPSELSESRTTAHDVRKEKPENAIRPAGTPAIFPATLVHQAESEKEHVHTLNQPRIESGLPQNDSSSSMPNSLQNSLSTHTERQPSLNAQNPTVARTLREIPPRLLGESAAKTSYLSNFGKAVSDSRGNTASTQGSRHETPEVHVHIGRIEVTAMHPASTTGKRPSEPVQKPMSLDEYLGKRQGGKK